MGRCRREHWSATPNAQMLRIQAQRLFKRSVTNSPSQPNTNDRSKRMNHPQIKAATKIRGVKPITDHAYINHSNGFIFPWCSSQNVTFSGVDITFGGDFIAQATSCDDCETKWETIYTLSGYGAKAH